MGLVRYCGKDKICDALHREFNIDISSSVRKCLNEPTYSAALPRASTALHPGNYSTTRCRISRSSSLRRCPSHALVPKYIVPTSFGPSCQMLILWVPNSAIPPTPITSHPYLGCHTRSWIRYY